MFDDNDDFDKVAKTMTKIAIVGNVIVFGALALFIIVILYLIKIWFFGGF